jgi:hypothetical protein
MSIQKRSRDYILCDVPRQTRIEIMIAASYTYLFIYFLALLPFAFP